MNKRVIYTVQQYYAMISTIQDAQRKRAILWETRKALQDELPEIYLVLDTAKIKSAKYDKAMIRMRTNRHNLNYVDCLIDAQDKIIDVTRGKMLDYDRMTFDQCIAYNEPVSSERFAKIGVCYSESYN